MPGSSDDFRRDTSSGRYGGGEGKQRRNAEKKEEVREMERKNGLVLKQEEGDKTLCQPMSIAAVVLAAGQGRRMHTTVAKQFLMLDGKPLLYYSLKAMEESEAEGIVIVTGEESISYCREEIVSRYGFSKIKDIVPGGRERYHSVYAGLCALKDQILRDGIVLIHDGARPFVTGEIISRTIDAAKRYEACVAAMPVKDTIKMADEELFSEKTLDRSRLFQIQTPQTFRYDTVKTAYDHLFENPEQEKGITDDAMVVETMLGEKVKFVEGSYQNLKVTTPEDMVIAEALLKNRQKNQRKSLDKSESIL